jgi:hypothetical protein
MSYNHTRKRISNKRLNTTRVRQKRIPGGAVLSVIPESLTVNKNAPIHPKLNKVRNYIPLKQLSSSIPSLNSIKPTISEHNYQYLYDTLTKISLGNFHRCYMNESLKESFYFYELDQIVSLLTTEINNITANSSSGGYAFTTDAAPRIIQELQRYIQYFKNVTYDFGRIDLKFHEALFE